MKIRNKVSDKNISLENCIHNNLASVKVYYFFGSILGMAPSNHKNKIKSKCIKSNLYFYFMVILYCIYFCYVIFQMKTEGDMKVMDNKCISCICLILILNIFIGIITSKKFPPKYFQVLAEVDLDFSIHNIQLHSIFYRAIYLQHLNYIMYLITFGFIKVALLSSFVECAIIQQIMLAIGTLCKTYASHALILSLFSVHLRFKEINGVVVSTQRENIFRKNINQGE